ncbi:MAG: flagellar basal body rod protein FlgC [Acetobacteraceae bacterium]|jgi:flagellar basal-body rod protein FlgC|nr:flagellar basal body rod protein FlgC [Acetobacteraceae bacterium]
MSLFAALAVAGSGMAAESERLSAVASNIANVNSVVTSSGDPYRAREVVFQAVSADENTDEPSAVGMAGVKVAAVVESAAPLRTVYDRGSIFADANGYVTMPNVNPVEEMVNMISAQQDYQANLEAFNVAKSLALRTLQI